MWVNRCFDFSVTLFTSGYCGVCVDIGLCTKGDQHNNDIKVRDWLSENRGKSSITIHYYATHVPGIGANSLRRKSISFNNIVFNRSVHSVIDTTIRPLIHQTQPNYFYEKLT